MKNIKLILVVFTTLCYLLPVKSYAQLTKDTTRFLGNIINDNTVPGNYDKYWNQITPENAGKWGNVADSKDTNSWNWSTLDFIYNYAVSHNYPFKFHNLVWGQTQPSWINSLSPSLQAAYVESWIRLAGKRYPKTALVDVVNEPLHSLPPYINAIDGSGKTGWNWVIWAFRKARIYFPNSRLLINENRILSDGNEAQKLIALIDTLKSRGLIDGIGCQGHYLENVDTAVIRNNLNRLASTGLPIYISEYEVSASDAAEQLEIYKRQFPLFWTYPDIKGITLWGYIEYKIFSKYAYLLTFLLEERPAMVWLHHYLDSYLQVKLIAPVDTSLAVRNPVLTWHSSTGAELYHVQIASDTGFTSIVGDTTVADTILIMPLLNAGINFYWHISAFNRSEKGQFSKAARFTTGNQILRVNGNKEISGNFILMQNYPNPFNPVTKIRYSIPIVGTHRDASVRINVYDVLGREIAMLVNKNQRPGIYEVTFNGTGLSSGIYFYRLNTDGFSKIRKMLLLK